jgi:lipopolysaccharide transport system ATP-binding protein
MLEAGLYSLRVTFFRHVKPNQGEELDATGWLGPLRISWDYEAEMAPFLGLFGLPVRGSLHRAGEEPAP